MDDEMMVPPFSVDPVLMYLRGIVLLRCVFDTLKRQKVLTPESLTWLVRAKKDFETSHEEGTSFDLGSYVRLAQNIADNNPHGEGKNEELFANEDKQSLIAESSDNQGASSDPDSQSGDAVPWWETLNDSEGEEEEEEEEEEDEIIADNGSVSRSDTNVKAEESDLEVDPDNTTNSPTPMSTGAAKEEFDFDIESDFDDLTVEPQVTVKSEPTEDTEFDFDMESDSESDEPVVKTELVESASPSRTPLSPVIPIKQEKDDNGFATLDDLLGSIPDKKPSKDKKKKKKKKRDQTQDDEDFDFDF